MGRNSSAATGKRSSRRLRRWLSLTAMASALSLTVAAVAFAKDTDNMYPTANADWPCSDGSGPDGQSLGYYCKTDNAELSAYAEIGPLTLPGWATIQVALSDFNNNSDLNVNYPSTAEYSGPNETDIIYQTGTVAEGNLGQTWCDDNEGAWPIGGTDMCDQHYVRFSSTNPDVVTACHESGHAVGLTHGQEAAPQLANADTRLGCMVTPRNTWQRVLGYNNVDNINETY